MGCYALQIPLLLALWSTGNGFTGQNTPPVFDMKREWLIPENEPIGSRIVTVRTRDDERDPIEYGIERAVFLDGSSYFRINKKTGDVFLSSPIVGLAGNDYYLLVTANDGHQTAKIEVYVRVLPPNRSSPDYELGLLNKFSPPLRVVPGHPYPTLSISRQHIPSKFNPFPLPSTSHSMGTSETSIIVMSSTTPSTVASADVPSLSEPKGKTGTDDWVPGVLPVIATIAFAPVGLAVLWIFRRKCQRQDMLKAERKLSERRESELSEDLDPHSSVLYLQRPKRSHSNRYESGEFAGVVPENQKWEFARHHLRFLGMLGEGCFGQVWKCEALNISNIEGASLVAVKTLKENASEKEKKDLVTELEMMKLLGPHPNVVTLLGCCTERDPMFVIMEFVENGKLQSYLRESRAERFYGNLHGSSRNLTSRDLTSFAYQITKGMEYLAAKGIIHRDLAARNILVSENKTCKVADFGFARDVIMNHVYERKSEGRLPIRWMAPESLFDNLFTSKTDVWSFGIVMWEIVTLGSTPYPGMAAGDVMKRVREGFRLEKPEHCKREMYNIMFYCWDRDPANRPSFSELAQLLDKLLISENDYIELDRFPDHSYYNITNLSGEKL